MPKALLIVDPQKEFVEGGRLAAIGGNAVCEGIAGYVDAKHQEYAVIIASQDWHLDAAEHFEIFGEHCIADTEGAELHDALRNSYIDFVVRKGLHSAAFSAFEAFDNNDRPLEEILNELRIDTVDVCGIATEYCVLSSCLDARAAELRCNLLLNLCAPIDEANAKLALAKMYNAGVRGMFV